ncbi:hypothetical protein UFOVP141_49 [uncultured Caudovirales phage]|uniref:Uncharacterized protein n=1 Tax=uncultured Caudovirales phage TaxID=2100421 RepID=A0A6J7VNV5_9CAUD|nr:hypothetical protein UFOVP141_49 [uncultured Caudovirales phage]
MPDPYLQELDALAAQPGTDPYLAEVDSMQQAAEAESTEANAMSHVPGPLKIPVSFLRRAGGAMDNMGARIGETLGLPLQPPGYADQRVRENRANSQAARAAAEESLPGAGGTLSDAGTSFTQTLVTPGGVGSKLLGAALTQGNESLTEARDSGMSEGKAGLYAAAMGAAEGVPGFIMNKMGLGTVEGIVANGLKSLLSTGKTTAAQVGKEVLMKALLPGQVEELWTTLGQQALTGYSGVDPDALRPANITDQMWETVKQTALIEAAGGSMHTGIDAVPSAARFAGRQIDKMRAAVTGHGRDAAAAADVINRDELIRQVGDQMRTADQIDGLYRGWAAQDANDANVDRMDRARSEEEDIQAVNDAAAANERQGVDNQLAGMAVNNDAAARLEQIRADEEAARLEADATIESGRSNEVASAERAKAEDAAAKAELDAILQDQVDAERRKADEAVDQERTAEELAKMQRAEEVARISKGATENAATGEDDPLRGYLDGNDPAASAAKKTVQQQERVAGEKAAKDNRQQAYLLEADLQAQRDGDLGGHYYQDGKLYFDPNRPNEAARMGTEKAQAFVDQHLGGDQVRADDPRLTTTRASQQRMATPTPYERENAGKIHPLGAAPDRITVDDLMAMPRERRMTRFVSLPAETRTALMPELKARMAKETWEEGIHGFHEPAPAPAAVRPVAPRPGAAAAPQGTAPAAAAPDGGAPKARRKASPAPAVAQATPAAPVAAQEPAPAPARQQDRVAPHEAARAEEEASAAESRTQEPAPAPAPTESRPSPEAAPAARIQGEEEAAAAEGAPEPPPAAPAGETRGGQSEPAAKATEAGKRPNPAPAAPAKASPEAISLMKRVRSAIERVTRGRWKVTEHQDGSLSVQVAGGATVTFRPAKAGEFSYTPEAWWSSVGSPARVQKAMRAAGVDAAWVTASDGRARFLAWAKSNPALAGKAMEKIPPWGAISTADGRFVALDANALVKVWERLDTALGSGKHAMDDVGKQAAIDTTVEEEIQHWVWQHLLTSEERKVLHAEVAKRKLELANLDPSDQAVMEEAYKAYQSARADMARERVQPRFMQIIGRLKNSIMDWVRALRGARAAGLPLASGDIWRKVESGEVFDRPVAERSPDGKIADGNGPATVGTETDGDARPADESARNPRDLTAEEAGRAARVSDTFVPIGHVVAQGEQDGSETHSSEGGETVVPPGDSLSIFNHEEWKRNVSRLLDEQGVKGQQKQKFMAAVDAQVGMMQALAMKDGDLYPHSANERDKQAIKDFGALKNPGPIRGNSDGLYRITFDLTSMCVRRLDAGATAAYVSDKIGRPLSGAENMALVLEFRRDGKTAPCLYCYVESPRRKMMDGLNRWMRILDGKEQADGKDADAAKAFRDAGATGIDINFNAFLNPEHASDISGPTVDIDGKQVSLQDFIRTKVTAQVKGLDRYEEYAGQIARLPQSLIEYLNGRAGIRFFSNSDFQPEHLVDLMQAVVDGSARKARAHVYSKIPDFVRVFGRTGMKINTSIFAKTVDGKVVEDAWMGMKWDDAKRFRSEFPDVGAVLVATDDTQIRWALDQGFIDYIIPYHHSGLSSAYSKELNWDDYTSTQRDTWKDGRTPDMVPDKTVDVFGKKINLRDLVQWSGSGKKAKQVPVIRSQDYLDLDKGTSNGLAKKRYLKICDLMGVDHVFPQFIDHPNYIKLKKDFARTDTKFNPLSPTFDTNTGGEIVRGFAERGGDQPQVQNDIGDRLVERIKNANENEDIAQSMLKEDAGQSLSVSQIDDFDPETDIPRRFTEEQRQEDSQSTDSEDQSVDPVRGVNEQISAKQRDGKVRGRETLAEEANSIDQDQQWQDEIKAKIRAGQGIDDREEFWLTRKVSQMLDDAGDNRNRWSELMELAALRAKDGTWVGRALAARRSAWMGTSQGRRSMIRSMITDMGPRWQRQYNNARTDSEREAVAERWRTHVEGIVRRMREKYGVDLHDPRLGDTFGDSLSTAMVMSRVSEEAGHQINVPGMLSWYVVGNLLSLKAVAANATGFPLIGAVKAFQAVPDAVLRLIDKDNKQLSTVSQKRAAVWAGMKAMWGGVGMGMISVYSGDAVATKQAGLKTTYDEADRAGSSTRPVFDGITRRLMGQGAGASYTAQAADFVTRMAGGPFLEVNRLLDETAWHVTYRAALTSIAVREGHQGQAITDFVNSPSDDARLEAADYANEVTLKPTHGENGGKFFNPANVLAMARDPSLIKKYIEKQWPNSPTVQTLAQGALNPLFLVMPFFNAIARLTYMGASLSPYGVAVHGAAAVGRLASASRMEKSDVRDRTVAKASKNLGYVLAGLAIAALVNGLKDKDDDGKKKDAITGSEDNYKSPGEREVRKQVESPRSIYGHDYSRFDPAALPAALHADLRDTMRKLMNGGDAGKELMKLGEKAWNSTIGRQFLSGLDGLFRKKWNDDGEEMGMIEKFTENAKDEFMPGRQWSSAKRSLTETTQMERGKSASERAYGSERPVKNLFGEDKIVRDGTTMDAIGHLFSNPDDAPSPEAKRWIQVIYDANRKAEESGGKPQYPSRPSRSYTLNGQKQKFTDEQYADLQERTGKQWLQALTKFEKRIMTYPPDVQAQVIKDLHDGASAYARASLLRDAAKGLRGAR